VLTENTKASSKSYFFYIAFAESTPKRPRILGSKVRAPTAFHVTAKQKWVTGLTGRPDHRALIKTEFRNMHKKSNEKDQIQDRASEDIEQASRTH
jgi:hypothetical protein